MLKHSVSFWVDVFLCTAAPLLPLHSHWPNLCLGLTWTSSAAAVCARTGCVWVNGIPQCVTSDYVNTNHRLVFTFRTCIWKYLLMGHCTGPKLCTSSLCPPHLWKTHSLSVFSVKMRVQQVDQWRGREWQWHHTQKWGEGGILRRLFLVIKFCSEVVFLQMIMLILVLVKVSFSVQNKNKVVNND